MHSYILTKNKIKYIGINLTKEEKDLYTDNYKILIKEIKEDSKKWKDMPYCSFRRILLKWPYYSKQSTDFM